MKWWWRLKLTSPDLVTRCQAVAKLAQPRDAEAVELLVPMLKDPHWNVRAAAAKGLAVVGDAKAVGPLARALVDPEPSVRGSVRAALDEISPNWPDLSEAKAVLPRILEMLSQGSVDQRSQIEIVSRFNDARIVDPLIAQFEQKEEISAIEKALAAIGIPAILPLLHACDSGQGRTVQRSQRALVDIGSRWASSPAALDLVPPLIEVLKRGKTGSSLPAARMLGLIRDRRAVDALIDALKHHNKNVRASAAHALGEIGDARGAAALLEASEGPDQVGAALEAAARIGDPNLAETIRERLRHPKDPLFESALKAAAVLRDAKCVPLLLEAAEGGGASRLPIVTALDAIDPNWVHGDLPEGLLRRFVSDLSSEWAQAVLVRIGRPAVGVLLEGLGHETMEMRRCSARVLGILRDPRAIEKLILAFADAASEVQHTAASSLGEIDPKWATSREAVLAASKLARDRVTSPHAVDLYGAAGTPEAVGPLIASLMQDPQRFIDVLQAILDRSAARVSAEQLSQAAALQDLSVSRRDPDNWDGLEGWIEGMSHDFVIDAAPVRNRAAEELRRRAPG